MAADYYVTIYSNDGSTQLANLGGVSVYENNYVTQTGVAVDTQVYTYAGDKVFKGIANNAGATTPDYAIGAAFPCYAATYYIVEAELTPLIDLSTLKHYHEKVQGEIDEKADGTIYQANGVFLETDTLESEVTPNNQIIIVGGENTEIDGSNGVIIGDNIQYLGDHHLILAQSHAMTTSIYTIMVPPYLTSYWAYDEGDGKYHTYPTVGNTDRSNSYSCAALGTGVKAIGLASFCQGLDSVAYGIGSFVHGQYSLAKGRCSAVLGVGLQANSNFQTVVGKYNENKSDSAFEVGWGTKNGWSPASETATKTIFRVTTSGEALSSSAIGVENSDGTKVTLNASQIEALLALVPDA